MWIFSARKMDIVQDMFSDPNFTMDSCFTNFDKNCDNKLDLKEFESLCTSLFCDDKWKSYDLCSSEVKEMFTIFDKDDDGFIDKKEFTFCWNKWIRTIIHPVSAVVIVDVQNDFISGSLSLSNCPAGQNGGDVVEPINRMLNAIKFDVVVFTFDWHPDNHISFYENRHLRPFHSTSPVTVENAKIGDKVVFASSPPKEMVLWPKHAVKNTWGSELHKDLKVPDNAIKVYKAIDSEIDSYSAFMDNDKKFETKLSAELKSKNVTDVYICGLAYDICVGSTVLDSLKIGFRTMLVEDCTKIIDECGKNRMRKLIIENKGLPIDFTEVKSMTEGRNRKPILGYKLAMELKNIFY